MKVELEESYSNTDLSKIADELEEVCFQPFTLQETYTLFQSNPRFIIYSYKWVRADGRKQFPLVLIHYTPGLAFLKCFDNFSVHCCFAEGSSPVQNMMYTRMKTPLVTKWQLQRAIELREKEDLNDEWLLKHLMKA